MPAFAGPTKARAIVVKRGTLASEVAVAGIRTKSVTVNGEPIDTTNDDDGGWADKLDDAAQLGVVISVSGVAINHTLLAESLDPDGRVKSTLFEYPGGGVIAGSFFLANYAENGEYNNAALFEAEFQSKGTITYTPGA